MERIASFTVNHNTLVPGLYLSRRDGDIITLDLRFKKPNTGDLLSNSEMHSAEHLIATLLRNSAEKDAVIYFGPMGCRTGCYFLMAGDYGSRDILDMIIHTFEYVRDFEGVIPGTEPKDCGNCLDHNLDMAKYVSRRYLEVLYHIDGFPESRLVYPEQ